MDLAVEAARAVAFAGAEVADLAAPAAGVDLEAVALGGRAAAGQAAVAVALAGPADRGRASATGSGKAGRTFAA